MDENAIREIIRSEVLNMLGNSYNIPYDVQKAFENRLTTGVLVSSGKSVASETQAVNEGGVATYSVPKLNDGFTQMTLGGITIYIPYYT